MGVNDPTPTVFVPYHAFDDLVRRGTRAAQPLATKVTPGTLYNVTDENKVERSSGLLWQSYASETILPTNIAYKDQANVFTQDQFITKAGPTLRFTATNAAADAKLWLFGIDNQPDFCIQARSDAGVVLNTPLTLYRDGRVEIGNNTRPVLVLKTTASTPQGRVASVVPNDIRLTRNAMYNGTAWVPDDATVGGAQLVLQASGTLLYGVLSAAASPVNTTLFIVEATGLATHYGHVIVSTASSSISHYDTGAAVDSRRWKWQAANTTLTLYILNDADSAVLGTPLILYRDGTVQVTGNDATGKVGLRFGGTTSAYPALRRAPTGGAVLEVTTAENPASLYATMKAGNFIATNTGNSLGDLTCTGASAFSGAMVLSGTLDIVGGSGTDFTTAPIEIRTAATPRISFHWPGVVASQIGMDSAGVIRTYDNPGTSYERFMCSSIQTSTNTWISNIHTTGYMYPAAVTNPGAIQASWYIAGHSSYGLYSNTGLYIESHIWCNQVIARGPVSCSYVEATAHIRAAGGLYDYARGLPIGDWTNNAGYWGGYFQSGFFYYSLVGHTLHIHAYAYIWTGGGPANFTCSHPFVSSQASQIPVMINSASAWVAGFVTTSAGGSSLVFQKLTGAGNLSSGFYIGMNISIAVN